MHGYHGTILVWHILKYHSSNGRVCLLQESPAQSLPHPRQAGLDEDTLLACLVISGDIRASRIFAVADRKSSIALMFDR